jgi:ATP-dependent Clp protease, protease subunit
MKEKNLVWLDEITTANAEDFLRVLKEDVDIDCVHIHLGIQSRGGSVPVAVALANLMMGLSCKITTYNIGNVDSSAVILFAAGQERVCSEKAVFHMHPIGKELKGVQTHSSLLAAVREIEEDTDRVTEFLANRSGITAAKSWGNLMMKSHTLYADEAMRFGLVHRIGEYQFK